MRFIPCFIAALLLFCTSCNEDVKEATDVAIFITPKASEDVSLNSGEKVRYAIELHTTHNYISRLQVASFDVQYGSQILEDVRFSAAQDVYLYEYTAPVFKKDTAQVTLTFTGWDDAGSMGETTRKVKVISHQILSDELTGIVLTENRNAIAFAAPTQPFNYPESPDSANADLYIIVDEAFAAITIQSNTKAKFVRNNSFDYAAATAERIQAVYESSRREDEVSDLRTNDIVIVGHGETAEGVFSITNIVREGTANERSVRLSFKNVSSQLSSRREK